MTLTATPVTAATNRRHRHQQPTATLPTHPQLACQLRQRGLHKTVYSHQLLVQSQRDLESVPQQRKLEIQRVPQQELGKPHLPHSGNRFTAGAQQEVEDVRDTRNGAVQDYPSTVYVYPSRL